MPRYPDAEDAVDLEHANGKVELSHVYFSYVPEQKLIEDFNLSVKPDSAWRSWDRPDAARRR